MSEPCPGDPQKDVEWKAFLAEAKKWPKQIKNVTMEDALEGQRILGALCVAVQTTINTRTQQRLSAFQTSLKKASKS